MRARSSRCLILWLATLLPGPVAAQATVTAPSWTRLPSLRFFGFRVGVPRSEIDSGVADLGGPSLECNRSRVDPRVRDCRTWFLDPITGDRVELWLATMDGLVGILTVSAPVSDLQLGTWRSSLVSAYGDVPVALQGSQRTLQWIRHRQMLRLTWRVRNERTTASVSLVDGPVVDGWGHRPAPPGEEKP